MTEARFQFYPRTEPPPDFALQVVGVFESSSEEISTDSPAKVLTNKEVLQRIRPELIQLGFEVEDGKVAPPKFFARSGWESLKYEIDAWHSGWHCGLAVEAGRVWMGNACYKDLLHAMVNVEVDVLILAVPISYRFSSRGRQVTSNYFESTKRVAEVLFGRGRSTQPYNLMLIGY